MTTPLSENAVTNEAVVGKHNATSPFSLRPAWTLVLALPGAVILGGALFAGGSLYVSQIDTRPAAAEVAQASGTPRSNLEASAVANENEASPSPAKFEQSLGAANEAEEPEAGLDDSLEDRLGSAETSRDEPRDVFTTASVARRAASGSDVAIAESEADVMALEGAMKEKAAAVAVTLDDTSGEPAESAVDTEGDMRQATATEHVNMRAGPENEADVLAVVPKGAELSASAACPQWCEVVYGGQRGWIYKSFVR